MFLIIGERISRRTLGYVAEVCPSCREPSVCRLVEVSRGVHLFYIPVGRLGSPLGHEARCLSCSRQFPVDAMLYDAIAGKKKMPLAEMIALTSPWLDERSAEEIKDESRFKAILNAFMRCDAAFRERAQRKGLQGDRRSGLALLLMFFGPFLAGGLLMEYKKKIPILPESFVEPLAWILCAAIVIWGVFVVATEGRRYYRRELLPKLEEELKPLASEWSDWEAVALRMKRLRFPTWKLVKRAISRGRRRQRGGSSTSLAAADAPVLAES